MKITQKLFTIFFVLSFFFGVGTAVYFHMENTHLSRIEAEEVLERQVGFEKILKLNQQAIFVLANDYSYWDELVNAIKNEDVQWAYINIDSGIKTYQADAAWVYNLDFKRIYSVNKFADERLKDLSLTKVQVAQIFNGKAITHFYIETPAGYMEIQGATVHPSDDSEHKTAPQGYFFVGKLWDRNYLTELSKLANCKVSAVPAEDAAKFFSRKNTFVIPVTDWGRSPLFAIVAAVDSVAIDHLKNQSQVLLQMFLLYTILQMFCLLYFLRRFLKKV